MINNKQIERNKRKAENELAETKKRARHKRIKAMLAARLANDSAIAQAQSLAATETKEHNAASPQGE
jgi:hypothetical protein